MKLSTRQALLFALGYFVALTAACGLWEQAKPIVRTLYDTAKVWCTAAMAEPGVMERAVAGNPEIAGLTVQDVCEREPYFRPFLDQLTSMHAGVMQSAGLAAPTAGGDAPPQQAPAAAPAPAPTPPTDQAPPSAPADGGT